MTATTPPPPGHESFTEMAAGYALHALEPDEQRLFERHLDHCASCAAEVAMHRDAVGALAHAVAAAPPAGLREAILADAAATRPGPGAAGPGAAGPRATRPVTGDAEAGGVSELDARRQRRADRTPWYLAVAAGVVTVAVVGSVASLQLGDTAEDGGVLAGARQVVQCGADPDCRQVWLADPDGTATAVVLVEEGRSTIVADALPPNDTDDETYVLWQQTAAGELTAVSTFDVERDGLVAADPAALAADDTSGTTFAVSIEPGRQAPAAPSSVVLQPVS